LKVDIDAQQKIVDGLQAKYDVEKKLNAEQEKKNRELS